MTDASPIHTAILDCPYCGEPVALAVEADVVGVLVQDCEVCCNPWQVTVRRRANSVEVEAARLDD